MSTPSEDRVTVIEVRGVFPGADNAVVEVRTGLTEEQHEQLKEGIKDAGNDGLKSFRMNLEFQREESKLASEEHIEFSLTLSIASSVKAFIDKQGFTGTNVNASLNKNPGYKS